MKSELARFKPRFVFVVGCQRSGTTLMSQIIGAHRQAILADETDGIYDWTKSIFESACGRPSEADILELRERAIQKYRDGDRDCLEVKNALVFQSPNLTWGHAQIAAAFPNARVVYMLRDVRAVVASMLRLTVPFVKNQVRYFRNTGFIPKEFPMEWKALTDDNVSEPVKMAIVAKIKMSLAANFGAAGIPVIETRYESLVSAPGETISAVIRHVGLPPDEACFSHQRSMLGYGPGGTDRSRPLDSASAERWRNDLDPGIVDSIWDAVGAFYEELGYAR